MLTQDQILFYGGALVAIGALVWLAITLVHYGIASRRLRNQLDAEYGKRIR